MKRGNDLGARLRALREARGLTQAQVATRAGFTPAYVAHIERGARGGAAIRYSTLVALTKALNTTVADLVGEVKR